MPDDVTLIDWARGRLSDVQLVRRAFGDGGTTAHKAVRLRTPVS